MVTKKTRALSIFATVLMLVSMLACFVIPASAEETVDSVKAMYQDVLANASADADGALAAALAADYADAAEAKAALAEKAAGVTLNPDVKPRYAYKAAYDAAGYAGKDWSIDQAQDWIDLTTEYATKSCALNLYVTSDIDFQGQAMNPLSYVAHGLTGLLDL